MPYRLHVVAVSGSGLWIVAELLKVLDIREILKSPSSPLVDDE